MRLLAHDSLRLELGGVVGRGQPLALVEAILAKFALVRARYRDRGHVVQASRPQRPRQFHRVVCAAHVDRRIELHRRGHVIHGGEMEEVIDRAVELGYLLICQSQQRLAQIPDDGMNAPAHRRLRGPFPALDQLVQASERVFAHQNVDLALALQQSLHQPTADEAGCSCHEIGHGVS